MSELRSGTLRELVDLLVAGAITRREFIARGAALGVSLSVLGWFVRSVQMTGAAPHPQDAAAGRPAAGTEGKTRGQDGELKILLWQAPTLMSPHVASGTKDFLAGSFILEPIMHYLPDGSLFPNLINEIPTMENGLLAADLTSVTFNITEGITWSDGEPFTAADVVFTWEWITNPENNSVHLEPWSVITAMEAVSDYELHVTYEGTNLTWYAPLTGGTQGPIYPKHYIEANGNDIMLTAAIGTGPYVVTDFRPNDQIIYEANPNYRDPNKPYFQTVNVKGGGDAATAAQSVLQTGDWDYAWNIQVEPEIINQYLEGGQGRFKVSPGVGLERLNINFSDPDTEGPDGQRSWYENPHPILSDPVVRQAINMGIDRDLIAKNFYAGPPVEPATANVLNGMPEIVSPNTSYTFDLEQAAQMLEDAGWVLNGDVREKNGIRLELDFYTSINSVRQKTQQVVKQNLEEIGFSITLGQVDSAIFFDGSAGNEQNLNHMYWDLDMWTTGPESPLPSGYMATWYAGTDNSNIAQAANGWNGQNTSRYISPEYDEIYGRLQRGEITDLVEAQQAFIQLNDIVIRDVATVPLVNRGSNRYCMHNSLFHGDEDNVGGSPFELSFWNVVNWNRATPVDR